MWGMMVTTIVVDLFKCTIKGSTPNFLHSKKVLKKGSYQTVHHWKTLFSFSRLLWEQQLPGEPAHDITG